MKIIGSILSWLFSKLILVLVIGFVSIIYSPFLLLSLIFERKKIKTFNRWQRLRRFKKKNQTK